MAEVTVLMAVYNGMPYLREAVESILGQTFDKFYFLIINDGSNDNTKNYLDSLKDYRITVIHQSNRGLGATLNRGIDLCKTKYIARMDADDISHPDRIAKQIEFLTQNEDIGLLGTQLSYIGNSGRSGFSPPLPCDHDSILSQLLKGRHAICHPSIIFRKSVLDSVGGYRITGVGEDLDMFLRVGEISKLANLQSVLFFYRAHYDSINIKRLNEVRLKYEYACFCSKSRINNQPEIKFEEFLKKWRARPFHQRVTQLMTIYALCQYRIAIADILGYKRFKGYLRLIFASVISPFRTIQRIYRELQKLINSLHSI